MLSEKTIVVAAKDQVSCELAGEAVILSLQGGVYYGLNQIGARIWELIHEPRTVEEIVARLMQEYEVDRPRCQKDLHTLLRELASHGLIEVRDGTAAQAPPAHAD